MICMFIPMSHGVSHLSLIGEIRSPYLWADLPRSCFRKSSSARVFAAAIAEKTNERLKKERAMIDIDLSDFPGTPAKSPVDTPRRPFIGGSDARIIMGSDEVALLRLWREKRGEVASEDLSANLIVQLGVVTEALNRGWFERNTGKAITDVQRRLRHPVLSWMAATLDGRVQGTGAVFEAKFMLPWSFSEEAALAKHMAQLQHNMWVVGVKTAVLSIITGGGKWVEIAVPSDSLYQHLLLTAEKAFWRCVQSGEPPQPFGVEPPRPRIEAVRIVDMSQSNSWAELAGRFQSTRSAFLEHERARTGLKELMPEDVKEAFGHGIKAKKSKSGAVSFDLVAQEPDHAAV